MLLSNGMQCIIKESTREDINKNTSTCIDHIFIRTKNINTNTHASIITSNISDHYALTLSLSEQEIEERKRAQSKQICSYKVNTQIRTTNWHALENIANVNDMFNVIHEHFNKIYETSTIIKKSKKRTTNPWMNEYLIKCCEKMDKLYKKWYLCRKNKNNELEYKKYRNIINKKLNYAKNCYYKNKFFENKSNIRVTWQIINEIIGKKTYNIDENIIKNFKNTNLTDICNLFATNFKENVYQILHKCDVVTINNSPNILENTLFLSNTNEEEIFHILQKLNENKSAGYDGIRPKDLRKNAWFMTPIITKLINLIMETATVPDTLKISLIRPIYKNGSKSDVNNYRPIAILSVIEKIMEEIICQRLTKFTKKYNVINRNQYGFQKGKNINKLLGNFANFVNEELSKSNHCLTLFIDFSKAFDTLSHTKLLQMLYKNGIRGKCLDWFRSYLSLRKYY